MFGLGPWELIIILIIVVFVFGGRRLPQLGEGIGKSITEFKKAIRDTRPSDQAASGPSSGSAGNEEAGNDQTGGRQRHS